MKLFSKIAFICNGSFVIFILLRYWEFNNKKNGAEDTILPLPFLTGTVVVLGMLAVFINLLFCLVILYYRLSKKTIHLPKWIVAVNVLFFIIQVFYFFIY